MTEKEGEIAAEQLLTNAQNAAVGSSDESPKEGEGEEGTRASVTSAMKAVNTAAND